MKILINENQLRDIINEAIPYRIAKKYLELNRNPSIKKHIDNMFNKLKIKQGYSFLINCNIVIKSETNYIIFLIKINILSLILSF